jgi:hypothetical protein
MHHEIRSKQPFALVHRASSAIKKEANSSLIGFLSLFLRRRAAGSIWSMATLLMPAAMHQNGNGCQRSSELARKPGISRPKTRLFPTTGQRQRRYAGRLAGTILACT